MEQSKFIVLYGSETGTAQDVAERIWREGKMMGLRGSVMPMDDYSVTQLPFEKLVVFVCSTTGQGEPPDNMKQFWKFLLRKNLPANSLQNVKFGVLGLGDSSYSKFNHAGKKLYRRLATLGGVALLEPGWADDQHDLGADAVVDPWISQLFRSVLTIHPQLSLPDSDAPLLPKWNVRVRRGDDKVSQEDVRLDWRLSLSARPIVVTSNVRTTPQQHFQEVRVLRFEREEGDLEYRSGDVAVVRPSNSEQSVAALLEAMPQMKGTDVLELAERDPDMPLPLHLTKPVSFLQLATHYWDINACPRRSVLEVLSRVAVEDRSEELRTERERLAELCSAEGQEDYFSYCTRPRRTTLELLTDFPHTALSLPPQYLFDIFPPIRPRMFSIASPPQGKYIEILVAVVKYKTRMQLPRLGLCSNWLASLSPGHSVQLDLKTGSLNFPKQGNLVMVGPGTGVAPFRSYICSEEFGEFTRARNKVESEARGGDDGTTNADLHNATLVFGCRNAAADFHFRDDFTKRTDLKVFTAFSRDQPHKIYVQHIVSEKSGYFGSLLKSEEPVCIMVAGNAKDMPQQVRSTFIRILAQLDSLDQSQAEKLVETMENRGLYQTETWS